MHRLEEKVLNFIYKNNLLDGVKTVYVAASGGADSMALLALLNNNKEYLNIDVKAVHVNHGIRGETARRDARFVENYCKLNNINFVLFDAESDGTEVPNNASEEWARELRYNYFNTLNKEGIKIATAHTLSDQLETVIFRMARGCGLAGLSGIPLQRDQYIRPFLSINRDEVEQLVEYYGTGHITDETNIGDIYSRNKIRHHVVPVLKEINKNSEESVSKLCDRVAKAQQFIVKTALEKLHSGEIISGVQYSLDVFKGIDEIIFEEIIIQLLEKIEVKSEHLVNKIKNLVNSMLTNSSDDNKCEWLQVNKDYSIVITTKCITIKKTCNCKSEKVVMGYNHYGQYKHCVIIEAVSFDEFAEDTKNKFNLCNYADASKLDLSKCVIRGKKQGDVFKPACKMGGKVVKFLREIPLVERDSVPLIEYEGKIIWVWGIGFTDGFTPSSNTKEILKFKWS